LSETAAVRFATVPATAQQPKGVPNSVSISGSIEASDAEQLLIQVVTGDREALSQLFRRFAKPIRSVGRRVLRDEAEADDLVQEVFLYIYRKSTLFDSSKSSARSWIFQIAYTQALLRRRRINSISARVSGIADNLHEVEPRAFSGADYDQTVEGLFGRNGWQRVQEALTEDQRETLRLFFFEGYTFAEIAEKLGQSFSNVRHHYYRGLEKLRKNLTENVLNRR
jgi:RNA polymerase sigma-70 factor (ECF subfamily)